MKLKDRTLSLELQGDDVALLHKELIRIGYTIFDEEVTLEGSDPFPLVKKAYTFANKAKSYHLSGCTARSTKTSFIASSDERNFRILSVISDSLRIKFL